VFTQFLLIVFKRQFDELVHGLTAPVRQGMDQISGFGAAHAQLRLEHVNCSVDLGLKIATDGEDRKPNKQTG
jgi:hypothetical protein